MVNRINDRSDIQQVLQQMRSIKAEMSSQRADVGSVPGMELAGIGAPAVTSSSGFGDLLRQAVDGVNDMQSKSAQLAKAYELGQPGVDITQVMVAMQKSSLSFQALTQVRNKVVDAYQTIMNMPI